MSVSEKVPEWNIRLEGGVVWHLLEKNNTVSVSLSDCQGEYVSV